MKSFVNLCFLIVFTGNFQALKQLTNDAMRGTVRSREVVIAEPGVWIANVLSSIKVTSSILSYVN